MTKAIEITRVGVRNCKPATVTPVPAGVDPQVFIATILADSERVVNSYHTPDTYAMCKGEAMINARVFKVRIIDIAVEAKTA